MKISLESLEGQFEEIDPIKKNLGLGCYLELIKKLNIQIPQDTAILELGSRDALDAIDLYRCYGNKVYAFEANPASIEEMRANCKHFNVFDSDIMIVPYAVENCEPGINRTTFYAVKGFDTGPSSLYPMSKKENDPSEVKKRTAMYTEGRQYCPGREEDGSIHWGNQTPYGPNIQTKIEVDCIRLDYWIEENNVYNISTVCMDLEGGELSALKSMGNHLDRIKYIITEGFYLQVNEGMSTIFDVDAFLVERGFSLIYGELERPDKKLDNEFIYKNTRLDTN